MRVAALQHDIVWEDRGANLDRLGSLVDDAAAGDVELIVLTEMFSVGFSMASDRVSEPLDGDSTAFLIDRASAHGAWLCASIPTQVPGAELPQNVLTLASPAGELHRYAKIHPFSYSGETDHYSPGSDFLTVEIAGCRCSFFICYDLRFADEFWALAADTDAYVVPANWPSTRREHWLALLRARAIENQAYVIGVNRVGEGDGLEYAGDSRVFDPMGGMIAAADDVEQVIYADVDPALVTATRRQLPFMADRR